MTPAEYRTALATPNPEHCPVCENGGRVPVGFSYVCSECGQSWYDDAMEDEYDWR